MADPAFTTRTALAAWCGRTARTADMFAKDQSPAARGEAQLEALETVRRVVAAHRHLIEEQDDDLPETKSLP